MWEERGSKSTRLIRRRVVGAVEIEDWSVCVDFLTMWWVPCLVMVSVQPWSTDARRCVPNIKGGFIICWVDKGVRNQRDVVIV